MLTKAVGRDLGDLLEGYPTKRIYRNLLKISIEDPIKILIVPLLIIRVHIKLITQNLHNTYRTRQIRRRQRMRRDRKVKNPANLLEILKIMAKIREDPAHTGNRPLSISHHWENFLNHVA